MTGKYKNGKILFYIRVARFLTGGNWKSGWSGAGKSGGEEKQYEIYNPGKIELIDDKWYKFEIFKDKAKIIKRHWR